ncbi:uncharacterized protein [Dermacentor albipictus]|uniref:uncharacterized protein isoform X3 n=1 Tax=Dermacentor albipictus TaxID=60249 RepID=UPI0038FD2FBF
MESPEPASFVKGAPRRRMTPRQQHGTHRRDAFPADARSTAQRSRQRPPASDAAPRNRAIRLSDTPEGRGGRSASPRIYHRLEARLP